jgi:hypothetical protein
MTRHLIIFFITITLTTSCYIPDSDQYLVIKPNDNDVLGFYEFKSQTVDKSIDNEVLKKRNPLILIMEDGTYRIEGLPGFIKDGPENYKFKKHVFLSGFWKIESIGTIDIGKGNFQKHWGLKLYSAPSGLMYAGLIGKEKPNGIIYTFGDPDLGKVMILNKK